MNSKQKRYLTKKIGLPHFKPNKVLGFIVHVGINADREYYDDKILSYYSVFLVALLSVSQSSRNFWEEHNVWFIVRRLFALIKTRCVTGKHGIYLIFFLVYELMFSVVE
jgi:hypothetical protein